MEDVGSIPCRTCVQNTEHRYQNLLGLRPGMLQPRMVPGKIANAFGCSTCLTLKASHEDGLSEIKNHTGLPTKMMDIMCPCSCNDSGILEPLPNSSKSFPSKKINRWNEWVVFDAISHSNKKCRVPEDQRREVMICDHTARTTTACEESNNGYRRAVVPTRQCSYRPGPHPPIGAGGQQALN